MHALKIPYEERNRWLEDMVCGMAGGDRQERVMDNQYHSGGGGEDAMSLVAPEVQCCATLVVVVVGLVEGLEGRLGRSKA